MTRLLLVGESPGPNCDPSQPAFLGDAGRRVARLLGVDFNLLHQTVATVNIFTEHVPHENWSPSLARVMYDQRVREVEKHYQTVLLCGWYVAKAARHVGKTYFEYDGNRVVFPHPSGKNRWYNDAENTKSAVDFLDAIAGARESTS